MIDEVTWSLQWNSWLHNIGGKIVLWYDAINLPKIHFTHYIVVYSKTENIFLLEQQNKGPHIASSIFYQEPSRNKVGMDFLSFAICSYWFD